MKLRLEATPDELEAKSEQLVETLADLFRSAAPDLSEILEKALPPKEQELKYPVLRDLFKQTENLYEQHVQKMLKAIGQVLDGSMGKSLEKGAPFIGPKGGKWADAAHTIPWKDRGEVKAAGSKDHMEKLRGFLKEKFGVKLDISQHEDVLTLPRIVVPKEKRSQGVGSDVMRVITRYADTYGKTIALTPSTDFGGTKAGLIRFYKRLGFVENKGKKKDYEISESMYRLPELKKAEKPFHDHTQAVAQRDDRAYQRVKEVLIRLGYLETDFIEGGPLYGWSTNQLIDLAQEKRSG